MPLVKFPYELRKVRGSVLAQGGYMVAFELRASDGSTRILGEQRVERFFHRGEFRQILKTEHLFGSDLRLRITRFARPESPLFTNYLRLAGSASTQKVSLGVYKFFDGAWRVSGSIVPASGFRTPLESLRGVLEVRSGTNYERFADLSVAAGGQFFFAGPRMFVNPDKTFDLRLRVLDEQGVEVGRYYTLTQPGEARNNANIRVGLPFLNVWREFRLTHPSLASRLENDVRFDPKKAHRTGDTFRKLRRYDIKRTHQVAEGVVTRSRKGPIGDPDWVWNIKIDRFYDSPEGFRLPNQRNYRRHDGLHVEACRLLSRAVLPDGVRARKKDRPVPLGERVWMLGTHVFDDTRDLSSRDHEHFELHPLYVMQPCMGGWFHFAVFESIALAPLATQVTGAPPRSWPWTSANAQAYLNAYQAPEPVARTDPSNWVSEISRSYEFIFDHFQNDMSRLSAFFARTSLRYDSLGVDLGTAGMPTEALYRKWAQERIQEGRPKQIFEALDRRLTAFFKFLYGPASFGLNPVTGPAPHSLLRCVYAMEAALAAGATGGQVGEANARISLNRATSKRSEDVRKEMSDLYRALFRNVTDSATRGRLFAAAIRRYRSWAVQTSRPAQTSRPSERWSAAKLREFGSNESVDSLVAELRARVDLFWKLLTPHRAR